MSTFDPFAIPPASSFKPPACSKCGRDIGVGWMLCYVTSACGGFGEYRPFHYDCAPKHSRNDIESDAK